MVASYNWGAPGKLSLIGDLEIEGQKRTSVTLNLIILENLQFHTIVFEEK